MTHTPLTVDAHLTDLGHAVERLATRALEAGLDAPVPTCPGWTVRELLAHQGMVHRWSTAIVQGAEPRGVDSAGLEAAGRAAADPVAWLLEGAHELVTALHAAPDDLEAPTFLKEAPPARLFWARRQDHETTMHALDALAAREGRRATAAEAWFGTEHALDGIDELLVGFWQRRGRGPRAPHGQPYSALVATHSGERWLLHVDDERVRTQHLGAEQRGPDSATAVLGGSAVDLYLALWNRGGRVDDPALLLRRWQETGAITW